MGNFVLTARRMRRGQWLARATGPTSERRRSYVLDWRHQVQEAPRASGSKWSAPSRAAPAVSITTPARRPRRPQPTGGDTPTVATKEEVEIEASDLSVREVRPVAEQLPIDAVGDDSRPEAVHIITRCLRLDLSSIALAKEDSAAGPSSGSAPWSSWPRPCGTGCGISIAAPISSMKAPPRRRRCGFSMAI